MDLVSNPAFTKADFTAAAILLQNGIYLAIKTFAFLLNSHVLHYSNPSTHILCFFFSSTQGEIKIIFQTFTTSGTSKPPVPHLFYFCFAFSTLPSPPLHFYCFVNGKALKRRERSADGAATGWERKCPRLHVPLWSGQVSRPEPQPNRTR